LAASRIVLAPTSLSAVLLYGSDSLSLIGAPPQAQVEQIQMLEAELAEAQRIISVKTDQVAGVSLQTECIEQFLDVEDPLPPVSA
jgi:hypothetical protein